MKDNSVTIDPSTKPNDLHKFPKEIQEAFKLIYSSAVRNNKEEKENKSEV